MHRNIPSHRAGAPRRARPARRGRRLLPGMLAGILLLPAAGPASAAPEVTPDQVASLLAAMHPGYERYISSVRYGASRLRPPSLYAGLVRRGGRDPRDPDDGPRPGRGAVYDLIVYADTFEPWRSRAWRLLVADHEYFHARHMSHATAAPVVGFGSPQADTDYYEAMAWGHVVARADQGHYGELSAVERAEAASRYTEHRERFLRFVMNRQASAWAHYGRFLPPREVIAQGVSGPPIGPEPEAGPARR